MLSYFMTNFSRMCQHCNTLFFLRFKKIMSEALNKKMITIEIIPV